MMRGISARITIAGLVSACVVGLWFLWQGSGEPSVAELTNLALTAPSVTEQTSAAIQLADLGEEALPGLRRVAVETAQPAVAAVCLQGLAKLWDYESMDLFFELAENGDPRVRGRAAQ